MTTVDTGSISGYMSPYSYFTSGGANFISKDLKGDGKKGWLGFKLKKNRMIKCFGGKLDAAADWSGEIDMGSFTTADAKSVDMGWSYLSDSNTFGWTAGITAVGAAFAYFF